MIDIEKAKESLDAAADAYAEILDALERFEDDTEEYGSEGAELSVSETVDVAQGALLDFREAIGETDPDVRLAKIGKAFLDECADRGFRTAADGDEWAPAGRRTPLGDGLARDGFRALVRRFL